MLYLFVLVNFGALIGSYKLTKDMLSPAVLFCIPWLWASFIMCGSTFDFDAASNAYGFLALGTIIFEIGYFFSHNRIKYKARLKYDEQKVSINLNLFKGIFCIETVFMFYVLIRYIQFLLSNIGQNIFINFYSNRDSFDGLLAISYGRTFVTAISVFSIVIYMFLMDSDKEKFHKLMMAQIIMGCICSFSRFTRNGILQSMLPLLIAGLIAYRKNSRKVFRILLVALVAFMVLFAYIAYSKYWYLFKNGNFWEVLRNQIALYASSPMVAFQKSFDGGLYPELNGGNTFRFIVAVFDRLMGTSSAVALEQAFINVGGTTTNVYTFYYYYLCDYGVIYALVIQFLVGIVHGMLYKKVGAKRPYAIFVFCFLMYPLLMQFFQDQYISLLSTWLQYILIGFILFKTNLLISHRHPSKKIIGMRYRTEGKRMV